MAELKHRIDFIYLFDVQNGNPNGDPDAGNLPRVDVETGIGLVTDVCLKRKIRNYVDLAKKGEPRFDIFIQEAAVLDNLVEDAYKADSVKDTKDKQKNAAKAFLCNKYYDIRAFGAVLATKEKQGQVRGPIQLTFAHSIDPVFSQSHTITRMAVTKDEAKEKEKTMGRKATIPYGLYLAYGFVSANLAHQTGFDQEDLELLWSALKNMFDNDRSAAKGLMAARKLIVFEHSGELGNAPANTLFDLVRVHKKSEISTPRCFKDYDVHIDHDNVPTGITIREIL